MPKPTDPPKSAGRPATMKGGGNITVWLDEPTRTGALKIGKTVSEGLRIAVSAYLKKKGKVKE